MEGDGFEREDRFAGIIHWLDVFLEPRGRGHCAELAVHIDKNSQTVRCDCSLDTGDIGSRLCSLGADADGLHFGRNPLVADIDIVIARGSILTGVSAQGDIVTARGEVAGVKSQREV